MKLKKAMRLYPIEYVPQNGILLPKWVLGDKYITFWPGSKVWKAPFNDFSSEQEAVAWLIVGAKPKELQPVLLVINHKTNKTLLGSQINEITEISLNVQGAQKVCNELYHAGYRPTKKPQ